MFMSIVKSKKIKKIVKRFTDLPLFYAIMLDIFFGNETVIIIFNVILIIFK